MSEISFDLISDLHIETWPEFDWLDQPTSPYCIIAGDVARDPAKIKETLKYLGKCYRAAFYIDGNDEHGLKFTELGASFKELNKLIARIPHVVHMRENVVIINGVALVAVNGWWTFDLDPSIDEEETKVIFGKKWSLERAQVDAIADFAYHDAAYLLRTIMKMQTHIDVKKIIVVSHTVPRADLIAHDIDLANTWRFNCTGNPHMIRALDMDTEKKITTWCFGHYHGSVDRVINGVRYVNNYRGRGDTQWKQPVYRPVRISVEI